MTQSDSWRCSLPAQPECSVSFDQFGINNINRTQPATIVELHALCAPGWPMEGKYLPSALIPCGHVHEVKPHTNRSGGDGLRCAVRCIYSSEGDTAAAPSASGTLALPGVACSAPFPSPPPDGCCKDVINEKPVFAGSVGACSPWTAGGGEASAVRNEKLEADAAAAWALSTGAGASPSVGLGEGCCWSPLLGAALERVVGAAEASGSCEDAATSGVTFAEVAADERLFAVTLSAGCHATKYSALRPKLCALARSTSLWSMNESMSA